MGNVRASIKKEDDGSLGLISQADYYPFGMLMPGRTTGANEYRFGYQGQFAEKDEETGYNQFEARLYDSRLGRWLTTDPAGQFSSPYLSVGNNPISRFDPDGRFSPDWFVGKDKGKVVHAPNYGKNDVAKLSQETGLDLKWFAREGAVGIPSNLALSSLFSMGTKGYIFSYDLNNSIKLMGANGYKIAASRLLHIWEDKNTMYGALGKGRVGSFDIDEHLYVWLETTYISKSLEYYGHWTSIEDSGVNASSHFSVTRTKIGIPKYTKPGLGHKLLGVHSMYEKLLPFFRPPTKPGSIIKFNYVTKRTIK